MRDHTLLSQNPPPPSPHAHTQNTHTKNTKKKLKKKIYALPKFPSFFQEKKGCLEIPSFAHGAFVLPHFHSIRTLFPFKYPTHPPTFPPSSTPVPPPPVSTNCLLFFLSFSLFPHPPSFSLFPFVMTCPKTTTHAHIHTPHTTPPHPALPCRTLRPLPPAAHLCVAAAMPVKRAHSRRTLVSLRVSSFKP